MVNKNINKKYRYILIMSAVIFFGTLLSFFLVVKPLYNKSKTLNTEAKTKQANLDALEDKKAKLEALAVKEEQLKEDVKKVEAALPEASQVGRLFIQIDQIAKASNGVVKSVTESGAAASTTEVATTETVSKLTYNSPLQFKNYFDFKNFITASETALKIMDITDFDINSKEDFSATLTSSTYVRNK